MTEDVLVAGIDSSTQSTKVVLVRAADGTVVDEASAPHPTGTAVDPQAWWEALQQAGSGLLERAAAIAVGGQQHGMVALDAEGDVIRPALLWNDLRSAPQISEVVEHLGGPEQCARTIGSVPAASFTVTKLRWMAENEPENAARTAAVLLPHDWLTWMLAGGSGLRRSDDDRPRRCLRHRLLLTGPNGPGCPRWRSGRSAADPEIPRCNCRGSPGRPRSSGVPASGAALGAGTGDNMAAALGLGLVDGDVAVSIGTSGTAFCVTDTADGRPDGFGGRFRRRIGALPAAGGDRERGKGAGGGRATCSASTTPNSPTSRCRRHPAPAA